MRDIPRPDPTRDLDTPEEIAEMVRRFYSDVAQDDLLGPIFNDVARVDWSEHLPEAGCVLVSSAARQAGLPRQPVPRPRPRPRQAADHLRTLRTMAGPVRSPVTCPSPVTYSA
jgi:hypothetical protein